MDQASEFVQQNKGSLGSLGFIVIAVLVIYLIYSYLYSPEATTFTELLSGDASARKPVHTKGTVPAIYTGGDFTLSFWIYVDDWNYRAAKNKFVFALSPEQLHPTSVSPLVGVLTPYQNGMMIRANVVKPGGAPAPGTAPASENVAGPDITVESNMVSLMNQQTSMDMFQSTVHQDKPCDIKDLPLQRWVCITIVSSGRVLDVYMDGKLTRSCVLDNVVNVPRGPLRLRLGDMGGFGGRYASVQMWNQQLTPDVIYGIYMMGPTQTTHNIFKDLGKLFNLNVSFTRVDSTPGATGGSSTGGHPSAGGATASSSIMSQLYADGSSMEQSLMSRF